MLACDCARYLARETKANDGVAVMCSYRFHWSPNKVVVVVVVGWWWWVMEVVFALALVLVLAAGW